MIIKVAAESSANMLICGSHHLIQLASLETPEQQKPAESIQMICPMGTNVYEGIFSDLKDKFPSAFAVLDSLREELLWRSALTRKPKVVQGTYFPQKNTTGGIFWFSSQLHASKSHFTKDQSCEDH